MHQKVNGKELKISPADRHQMRSELGALNLLADYQEFRIGIYLFVVQWEKKYPHHMHAFTLSDYHEGGWAYSFTGIYNEHNSCEGRNATHKRELKNSAEFMTNVDTTSALTLLEDLTATMQSIKTYSTRQSVSVIPLYARSTPPFSERGRE